MDVNIFKIAHGNDQYIKLHPSQQGMHENIHLHKKKLVVMS
jgi:hypothetical protein